MLYRGPKQCSKTTNAGRIFIAGQETLRHHRSLWTTSCALRLRVRRN